MKFIVDVRVQINRADSHGNMIPKKNESKHILGVTQQNRKSGVPRTYWTGRVLEEYLKSAAVFIQCRDGMQSLSPYEGEIKESASV